jgi:WD40 repeat protein
MDADTIVSSSGDSTTRIWSTDTRMKKGVHESEKVNISETSSTQQTVGKHIITAKEDLLLISEDQKVVAFFRAPAHITTMQFVSDMIAVVCSNGDSVHLRAPCLGAEG